MKNVLLVFVVLLGVSSNAVADFITYNTLGSEFTLSGVGQGTTFQLGSARFEFIPIASATVNANPITIGDYGQLVISGPPGFSSETIPAGLGLRIKISQISPVPQAAFLPIGNLSGNIAFNSSSTVITWPSPNTITLGPTEYSILNNPAGIVPPTVNGGLTTIQGIITSVPEPTSIGLVALGAGLLVAFRFAKKACNRQAND